MVCVDLEKAYDSVDREMMWSILEKYGTSGSVVNAVRLMYVNCEACVNVKTRSLSTMCELREHPQRWMRDATNVSIFNNNCYPLSPTRPPPGAQLHMLCYTVLRITLQASAKSKLRATHIHHGQVSNIIKHISNTDKRTIHNNIGKHASYVNTQHHVTAWTVTVGSPQ